MYQDAHPNMIRVEESHFNTTLAAYATTPGIELDGWDSLKHTIYAVEYRRGTRIAEAGLTGVVAPDHLTTITLTEQGLKRLITGRIDVYVDVEVIVTETLKRLDPMAFDSSRVYRAGIMAQDTLHAYLHQKHRTLAPKVSEVLKTMKQAGLVDQYRQRALTQQ